MKSLRTHKKLCMNLRRKVSFISRYCCNVNCSCGSETVFTRRMKSTPLRPRYINNCLIPFLNSSRSSLLESSSKYHLPERQDCEGSVGLVAREVCHGCTPEVVFKDMTYGVDGEDVFIKSHSRDVIVNEVAVQAI